MGRPGERATKLARFSHYRVPLDMGRNRPVKSDKTMAHRTFVDRIGMTWEVWDVRPSSPVLLVASEREEQALPEGWLCFQSGSTRKRLFPIPDGWESMAEDELI